MAQDAMRRQFAEKAPSALKKVCREISGSTAVPDASLTVQPVQETQSALFAEALQYLVDP